MTFISYAQNFEDVLLWRALRHVPDGFYIDVGASHPDIDSTTRAFYDRGWRGLNIEPVAEDAARIAAARPRDVTLQLAAGASDDETWFFVVPGTGLSTIDPAVAERHGGGRWRQNSRRIARRTLAGLCRAHVRGPIHFLKIDVEGAEADVLAGADLVAYRPWIILVEATAPLSTRPTHAAWEPQLLARGYRFIWFDGLNRFYLADEQADALEGHFQAPPNVFDDFIRAADTILAGRLAAAEARAETLDRMLEASTSRATETAALARQRRERSQHELAQLQQQLGSLRRRVITTERSLRNKLHHALHEVQMTHLRLQAALRERDENAVALQYRSDRLHETEAWLSALRKSTSWRLTAPVRVALRKLGRSTEAASADQMPISMPAALLPPAPPPAAALASAPGYRPADGFFDVQPPPAARLLQGRERHSVHQFHSGSALADAITNAMLLTRRLLRDLGYASEIFVTHLDPELSHELRSIDELPLHDGYVLIVRHSMGHDAFDQIAALPAPKILMYHNITPPELVAQHPSLAANSILGRRQLAALAGHVHAALADSEYNAIELRQLGFEPVRCCTLLFDIARIRARAEAAAGPGSHDPEHDGHHDVFTILFVGRICQSKAQLELLDAYLAFRSLGDMPARLVLVGRDDGEDDPYLLSLKRRIADSPHPDEVLLTGLLSDAERDGWYSRADLYVSLSRHEGFGVPLIEAMAHGLPVLARSAGAVSYTLGGAACLLPDDSGPADTGAMMRALAIDPQRRAIQAAAQRISLDRFALPGQAAILVHALLRAGAALPPGSRDALEANLGFAVTGHVNKTYSLAAVNRGLALALEAAYPGRVRVIPVEEAVTEDLSEVPDASRPAIAALVGRAAPLSAPELIVSQHYPVHVPPRIGGQIRLALLFWEESLLPAETIATLAAGFDGVVAPTRFVARALQDSGLRLPVRVIDHAPELAPFHALGREPPLRALGTPLTFLHVSSCFPRKGADVLLRAWAASFTGADPVRLLIKSFPNPHNTIAADLAALSATHPDLAPITLIDQDLDEAAMIALYARSDVMVLPSRGEGYNLPAAEALAAGLRLIVTGAGGHMDFCRPDDPRIRLLAYRHAASTSHLATPHSLWFEPDPDDLSAALREAFALPALALALPAPASGPEPQPSRAPAELARFAIDLLLRPPGGPLRIAWISSWSQKCGVAEYSRLMLDALEPDPAVSITLLCDDRTPAYASLPGHLQHVPCWRIGEDTVTGLLHAIARTDAQAVVVQHQPGLIEWPRLARLIDGIVAQGRVLTVTLHNTRNLLDQPPLPRASVLAALGRADRIIVHTLADLDRLTVLGLGFGMTQNLTLFPHGLQTPLPIRAARALDTANAPILGCYGFFLPGKGIDTLIEAVILLRRDWPGLTLRLVNAVYGGPESDAELARARMLAAPLGSAVEFYAEFLPHDRSLALLGDCDLIVLPHHPSKEGSSAALRTALAASIPVAVSRIDLFDEAEEAVLRIDAKTPNSLARDLDALLNDLPHRQRLQQNAAEWMHDRAWPPIAHRFTGLLTGLIKSHRSG